MLTPEIKAKWIEALRSGKYAQTTGRLKTYRDNTTRYCCLGVLGEVMGKPEYTLLGRAFFHGSTLSIEQENVCVRWNDTEGCSFPEIADRIERGELEKAPA